MLVLICFNEHDEDEAMVVTLREFMDGDEGWGPEHGRRVHARLSLAIREKPADKVVSVSLVGVKRLDVAFVGESILEVAIGFRRRRGVCLIDVDPELLANLEAAALQYEQPITLCDGGVVRALGPKPTEGTRVLLDYALTVPTVTARECAEKYNLQIANVSNKLKYLFDEGFLLRTERPSGSGGIEHVYSRIC